MEDIAPRLDLHPSVPKQPKPAVKAKVDVRYVVISPYASAHIHWDPIKKELVYDIEEPLLNTREKFFLERIKSEVNKAISEEMISGRNTEDLLTYIDKLAKWMMEELKTPLQGDTYEKVFYYLYRDFIGLNEIDPLFRDPFVEEIQYNGVGKPIFIYHRVYGTIPTNLIYRDINVIANYVLKLAKRCEEQLTTERPMFDSVLPDGSSVSVTYNSAIESKGPLFSIKKIGRIHWTPTQLIDMHIVSPEMIAYLWILIQHKANVLIVGKSGSGKTSLMSALKLFVPSGGRIVDVEGSEIKKRGFFRRKKKQIIDNKVRDGFKKRPDFVFSENLSETETVTLFQSMLADHGTITSIEAADEKDAISKITNPPINLSPKFLENIDATLIINNEVVRTKNVKRLKKITEIDDVNSKGEVKSHVPFIWEEKDDRFYFKMESRAFERIVGRYNVRREDLLNEFRVKSKMIYEMHRRGILDAYHFQKVINNYYENPDQVLLNLGIK